MGFKFSANTGYLWTDHPFPDRIRRAAAHGFDGVEFHDEAQSSDRTELKDVLTETGMPVYSLNTRMGSSFGCAAIPGATEQARRDVDTAIEVAQDTGSGAIHVLAGLAAGKTAHEAFLKTLRHALDGFDRTILIEPISTHAVPGYFLNTIAQAAKITAQIGHPRLKILFDCYHIHHENGDVAGAFAAHADQIGHVQISEVETRAEPFPGLLDYGVLLRAFQAQGYAGAFGCEYRPAGTTEAGLHWRAEL